MIIIIDLMQCKMENNLVSEKKEDAEMFSRGTCTRYHHSALQTVPYGRSSGSEIFEYSQILNSYRKERSHLFLFFHPHTCSHTHTHTHRHNSSMWLYQWPSPSLLPSLEGSAAGGGDSRETASLASYCPYDSHTLTWLVRSNSRLYRPLTFSLSPEKIKIKIKWKW